MTSYLQDYRQRQAHEVLKRRIVIGLLIGWILTLYGGWQFYFVELADPGFWIWMLGAGLACLALALLVPDAFGPLEMVVHFVGQFVFRALLLALLAVIYIIFFIPIGFLTRKKAESGLSFAWSSEGDKPTSGWQIKEITLEKETGRFSLLRAPFYVLSYFMARGHWTLLPVLIVMILIGLALLFLQTSVIAPMIYTLF